ncbi:MAG TPA: glycosyl hydrolase 108 family protein [Mucilaginibacter sp.]|nr:glycosyl hydrolase 108 family protein [Mucilaginibacter sp.]
MANFEAAKTSVLKIEAKFQTLPTDCGNYLTKSDCRSQKNIIGTNYGISAPVLQGYRKPITITTQDMQNLDEPTAIGIYKANYWDVIKGDQIENQSIADTFFDMAFNYGQVRTVKMMQTILKKRDPSIVVDGKFGNSTLKALNQYADQRLFDEFQQARRVAYIKANKPEFIKGWLNRVDKFKFVPQFIPILPQFKPTEPQTQPEPPQFRLA